ncbi:MAG: N-6 DNA methylase, partial [Azoarcus sp.]|nr:N-6 DNA methylase [Azoarcus sp.]
MTPQEFIARWKNNPLGERAGAQTFFLELCDLLGVERPGDAENYCFEYGAQKSSGGDGFADVYKRGFFGWESKKPGRDLKAALKQLTDYYLALESPPLLIVDDRERIEIHTAFTGYPDEVRVIHIDDLADENVRQWLIWAFTDPVKLRPQKSTAAITAGVAGEFGDIAKRMRKRGEDAQKVAHFLMQCLFCMFAEDEEILPDKLFTALLEKYADDAGKAVDRFAKLFQAMNDEGGEFGLTDIPWFNGGLFRVVDIPASLCREDLAALLQSARRDWRAIDPSIFGTLFERGLNPKARAQLGAHYTDTGTIDKLVRPLVYEPLIAEWEALRPKIAAAVSDRKTLKTAEGLYHGFMLRLENFRVLDPACGSGNFLYLSLRALREVEKRARIEAAEFGLQADLQMHTGPHNILGIEINEYAAELARVTVWIGDIQWSRQNGYPHAVNPILQPLEGIENRDALLDADGSEAQWPTASVVVGNPPFLGNKSMRGELGDAYAGTLRKTFEGRIPGSVDFVTYWFEKARAQIEAGKLKAAGLVATQAIRNGSNRKVLDRICETTRIFAAWSDEPWINEGAAVRVSLIVFGAGTGARLNGQEVSAIHADLTPGGGVDLTNVGKLKENAGCCFQGPVKVGAFDVPGETARQWLKQPNPNGQPNSSVVRPWVNASDLVHRPSDTWIVDFCDKSEIDAAWFEAPFQHVVEYVKPARMKVNREKRRKYWWQHGETAPGLHAALAATPRYIATPRVAKHRLFVWLDSTVFPDTRVAAIARADDCTFGILQSRFHEL